MKDDPLHEIDEELALLGIERSEQQTVNARRVWSHFVEQRLTLCGQEKLTGPAIVFPYRPPDELFREKPVDQSAQGRAVVADQLGERGQLDAGIARNRGDRRELGRRDVITRRFTCEGRIVRLERTANQVTRDTKGWFRPYVNAGTSLNSGITSCAKSSIDRIASSKGSV